MSNSYVVYIETAPLPLEQLVSKAPVFKAAANLKDAQKIAEDIEKKKNKYFEEAHLNESTGFVCAVALLDMETEKVEIINSLQNSEEKILSWLYGKLANGRPTPTVTFRGNKFVYPFISRRGAKYGIPFLTQLFYYDEAVGYSGQLDEYLYTDVAAMWACGSLSHPESMKEIADVLDIKYTEHEQPYYKALIDDEEKANEQLNASITTLFDVYKKLVKWTL